MLLPELQKTWEFDINQLYAAEGTTLATHQKLLFGIKHSLITVPAPLRHFG